MHTDEAVNAYIVGELLAGKTFTYDPQDRHGPLLAAFALPLARLQGAKTFSDLTESELRLTSVVAGTVTILLFGAAVEEFMRLVVLPLSALHARGPYELHDLIQGLLVHMVVIGLPVAYSVRRFGK